MTLDDLRRNIARVDALVQAVSDCIDRIVLEGPTVGQVRHIDRRRYEHLAHLIGEAVVASEIAITAADALGAFPGGVRE